jgi:hypothetical protein
MVRTVMGSVMGAGAGFVAGVLVMVVVAFAVRGDEFGASEIVPICAFVGVFLAGTGAIAGAVVGGTADLLGYWRRRERGTAAART